MKGFISLLVLGTILNAATKITAASTCPQGLPEDPEEDVLIPHESDCTKFYKCSHGEKVEQDCPVGLHFNAEANNCDWPPIAKCETNTNNGNNEFNACPNLPVDPPEGIFFPHEFDCTKFYQCSHGNKIRQRCPEGLHFNAETNKCDWPHIAKCDNDTNDNNETNKCPNLPEDPSEDILFPHESDCTKFYKCSHGDQIEQDCPKGLHFNPIKLECDWPANAKCEKNGGDENNGEVPENECPLVDPSVNILLPHESDCTKFYQCDNGRKVLQDCPAGLHFNPKIDRCDWPENAKCENSSKNNTNECPSNDPLGNILIPHEFDCSKFYQCSNGEKILHNCSVGLHFNPATKQCDWPENSNCSSGPRYLPHEENCMKFYQLVKGVKYEYICSDGLHFNILLQACDHKVNVKCQNNQIKEWFNESDESNEDDSDE